MDDYADFEYAGGAQCAIGWSYEALRNSGKIPKEQANPIIEQAYTAVLTKYPDCYVANYAAFRLAGMMLDKGDKAGAIKYYQEFLDSAKIPQYGSAKCNSSQKQDGRIEAVKAKLAELIAEGGSN